MGKIKVSEYVSVCIISGLGPYANIIRQLPRTNFDDYPTTMYNHGDSSMSILRRCISVAITVLHTTAEMYILGVLRASFEVQSAGLSDCVPIFVYSRMS